MSFTLRPYQIEDVDAVSRALLHQRYVLMQEPTGAGKTVMFNEIIKRHITAYSAMRILVLAHREILVRQTADKLFRAWPDAPVSIACAGAGFVDVTAPVVIASIQTLAGRMGEVPPFDLVIIDEAHRIPPVKLKQDRPSQYMQVLTKLEAYRPNMRVLGVTATPFRMGHGWVFGDRCRPGHANIWPTLSVQRKISDLQSDGYLVPYRALEAENIEAELANVKKRGGEFIESELATVMSRQVHLDSAVRAFREYGDGREHVVVFAVTIEHADLLAAAFTAAGFPASSVHSGMTKADRHASLSAFKSGRIRILVNVGVLTEGWDEPHTDCVMFCRPTLAPDLYVQMVGRGLRPHPDKDNLLILDLSGNCARHGDPDTPRVKIPGIKVDREGEPLGKPCPHCKTVVPMSTVECMECGHRWEQRFVDYDSDVAMKAVAWGAREMHIVNHRTEAYTSKSGNRMVKITLFCSSAGEFPTPVNHFIDVEGNGHIVGRARAKQLWAKLGNGTGHMPPATVDEFIDRADELHIPDTVMVKPDGKYLKIMGW